MRHFLAQMARSRTLKIAAAVAALISGVDDLVEAYFGVTDMFGLDVAHGIVITALTSILDPLSKLIGEGEKEIKEFGKEERTPGE